MTQTSLTALDAAEEPGRPQLLASATIWLLVRYAREGGCARLHHVLAQHLALLAEHPSAEPQLRETCALLLDQWDGLAPPNRSEPVANAGLLGRLGRLLQ